MVEVCQVYRLHPQLSLEILELLIYKAHEVPARFALMLLDVPRRRSGVWTVEIIHWPVTPAVAEECHVCHLLLVVAGVVAVLVLVLVTSLGSVVSSQVTGKLWPEMFLLRLKVQGWRFGTPPWCCCFAPLKGELRSYKGKLRRYKVE